MKNFVSIEKRAPKEVSKSSYSNLFQKILVKEMVTEPFFIKFVGLRFFKKVVCYGSFLEIFLWKIWKQISLREPVGDCFWKMSNSYEMYLPNLVVLSLLWRSFSKIQKQPVINLFLPNISILYSLKTPEKLWFSGVLRGYKMVMLAKNELPTKWQCLHYDCK